MRSPKRMKVGTTPSTVMASLKALFSRPEKSKPIAALAVEEEKLSEVSTSNIAQPYVLQLGARDAAKKRREKKQKRNLLNQMKGGFGK